ncbi:transposase [Micromonospora sp. KC207]|uniref:transposase n=1 Tax=Micromonospora sp. KC207 TaxID=2530377 RepID=UPI001FB6680B|nr:transposase [Micromonospora sp. KC207]
MAADAGYGDNSQFRSALDQRGIGYIMPVKGDALAHKPDVRPAERVWSGRGRPPTCTDPRYPKTAISLVEHVRATG